MRRNLAEGERKKGQDLNLQGMRSKVEETAGKNGQREHFIYVNRILF